MNDQFSRSCFFSIGRECLEASEVSENRRRLSTESRVAENQVGRLGRVEHLALARRRPADRARRRHQRHDQHRREEPGPLASRDGFLRAGAGCHHPVSRQDEKAICGQLVRALREKS